MRDLWDEFTVRIYALIHIRKYREKATINLILFFSSLVIFCEIVYIAQGGKFSPFGVYASIVIITLFAYTLWEVIAKNRRARKADSTPAAIHRINIIVHKLNKLVKCKEKGNE